MADPRIVKRNERKDTRSDLIKAVIAASMSRDEVPNFCPYGCEDHELDDNGYCHHLVGFTNGGDFYEPRAINHLGKEFVDGTNRKPMKKGFYRERITTSARVYSRKGNPALVPATKDVADKNARVIADKEREYAELLERLKTPALSGVFEGSEYDIPEPYNPEDGLDAAAE